MEALVNLSLWNTLSVDYFNRH